MAYCVYHSCGMSTLTADRDWGKGVNNHSACSSYWTHLGTRL